MTSRLTFANWQATATGYVVKPMRRCIDPDCDVLWVGPDDTCWACSGPGRRYLP